MNRAFLLLIVTVGILATALAVILVLALLPYIGLIGVTLVGIFMVLALASTVYVVRRLQIDLAHRRAIVGLVHLGEHGAYVLQAGRYEPLHPTSVHVAAVTPRVQALPSPQAETPATIDASAVTQPQLTQIITQLQANALEVAFGVEASTGKLVKTTLPQAVHIKLIGASGFGKSTLAASILAQIVAMNSPDVVRIALLDLENLTSKPFQQLPHVLEIGRKRMVATDAEQVAVLLGMLVKELNRRADNGLTGPTTLVYVEEFLSLQYELDDKLKERMLADFSVLSVRGRKYGICLLGATQTDYATDDLRTAQKQFRTRLACAVDPSAGRAAGFVNNAALKKLFADGRPGDFLIERPGQSTLILAPYGDESLRDVRAVVATSPYSGSSSYQPSVVGTTTRPDLHLVEATTNEPGKEPEVETAALSERAQAVLSLLRQRKGQNEIIETVWGVKSNGGRAYQEAVTEYREIIAQLVERGAAS